MLTMHWQSLDVNIREEKPTLAASVVEDGEGTGEGEEEEDEVLDGNQASVSVAVGDNKGKERGAAEGKKRRKSNGLLHGNGTEGEMQECLIRSSNRL